MTVAQSIAKSRRSCWRGITGAAIGSVLTGSALADATDQSMETVDELLKKGFSLVAVSESATTEGAGVTTQMYLQKQSELFVCSVAGVTLGKAMQLWPCEKFSVDRTLLQKKPKINGGQQ